jgi:hypothetical protein
MSADGPVELGVALHRLMQRSRRGVPAAPAKPPAPRPGVAGPVRPLPGMRRWRADALANLRLQQLVPNLHRFRVWKEGSPSEGIVERQLEAGRGVWSYTCSCSGTRLEGICRHIVKVIMLTEPERFDLPAPRIIELPE